MPGWCLGYWESGNSNKTALSDSLVAIGEYRHGESQIYLRQNSGDENTNIKMLSSNTLLRTETQATS
jgi:hypothetical protein